jgi:hypothetical protein
LYTAQTYDWLVSRMKPPRNPGDLQRVLVRDAQGAVVGWYIYMHNRAWVSQVVQFVTTDDQRAAMLMHLFRHARERGALAVGGNVEASMVPDLTTVQAPIRFATAWAIAHTRNPDIRLALHGGNTFLSRLEGEWVVGWS